MKNKKIILSVAAALVIAAGVIGWLLLGGDKPVNVKLPGGVNAKLNASLKNSVLTREQDGRKLWEFNVAEALNDRQKNIAHLKGVTGKVYRKDGSYLDIVAERGEAATVKHDFSLEGKVKAVLSTGGELYCDKITWNQDKDIIIARGHVKVIKDQYTAEGDMAQTTGAFQKFKLKGHAKVTKGGE